MTRKTSKSWSSTISSLIVRYAIIRGVCRALWMIAFPRRRKMSLILATKILQQQYNSLIKKQLDQRRLLYAGTASEELGDVRSPTT